MAIYNGMIKYELVIHVLVSLSSLLSFAVSLRKWFAHSLFIRGNGENLQKSTLFESDKRGSIFWSDKGFKGTFANRTWPFFQGRVTCNLLNLGHKKIRTVYVVLQISQIKTWGNSVIGFMRYDQKCNNCDTDVITMLFLLNAFQFLTFINLGIPSILHRLTSNILFILDILKSSLTYSKFNSSSCSL